MKIFDFNFATKNQIQIIKTGLDHISSNIWTELGKEPFNLYIKIRKPVIHIFLVRHEDVKFLKDIKTELGKFIEHSGIYFGFILEKEKEKEFHISLEGAEFLWMDVAPRRELNIKKITVMEAAAKSFLYGNSINPSSFLKSPEVLNRKDLVFVFDPLSRFLGIGYIFKKYLPKKTRKTIEPPAIELRNLIDYGYYIRRGA
jgi:ribosome biogenesis protein Nip4